MLCVKRQPGTNNNELTNQNLVKMEEKKKATREKFNRIKYVLDQVTIGVEKWHHQYLSRRLNSGKWS